ncbi:MAG TPA: DUF3306 domain-containing protein [Burkholderiaceae bacterium]|nr:DUF3306 domain-containing protein [Burkholderiaceae bacterium]
MSDTDGRFLSRWSRLKRRSRDEAASGQAGAGADRSTRRDESAMPAPAVPAAARPPDGSGDPDDVALPANPAANFAQRDAQAAVTPQAGNDDDAPLPAVESLTPGSDFRPFMRAGIDSATRNAALKRLFADPQFNVMDGLDVYIDDYGKAEPIPEAMLRRLVEEQASRLFDPAIVDAAHAARVAQVAPLTHVGQSVPEAPEALPAAGERGIDRGEVGPTGERGIDRGEVGPTGETADSVDHRSEAPADGSEKTVASEREPDDAAPRADVLVDDVDPRPGVQRR